MTTLPAFAVGRTDLALPAADIEATASYARNEKAPATHAAYQSDFAMFRERAWARASAPCRQAQPRSQPFSPMRLIENLVRHHPPLRRHPLRPSARRPGAADRQRTRPRHAPRHPPHLAAVADMERRNDFTDPVGPPRRDAIGAWRQNTGRVEPANDCQRHDVLPVARFLVGLLASAGRGGPLRPDAESADQPLARPLRFRHSVYHLVAPFQISPMPATQTVGEKCGRIARGLIRWVATYLAIFAHFVDRFAGITIGMDVAHRFIAAGTADGRSGARVNRASQSQA